MCSDKTFITYVVHKYIEIVGVPEYRKRSYIASVKA